jgi:hypothetical protein
MRLVSRVVAELSGGVMELKGECILHRGSVTNAGYGQVARNINGKFRVFGAHRFAWEQKNGPIPDGLCVLHKCDNKLCINVDHLWLGTQQDNMREAMERGRFKTGQEHPRSATNRAKIARERKANR